MAKSAAPSASSGTSAASERPSMRRFAMAAFLVGLLLGLNAPSASAQVCVEIKENVEAARGPGTYSNRGVAAGDTSHTNLDRDSLWVPSANSATCNRASSIAIKSTVTGNADFIEFGWVQRAGASNVVVFVVTRLNNGQATQWDLHSISTGLDGQSWPFEIANSNADTIYTVWWAGQQLATRSTVFTSGEGITNSERHNLGDSLYAELHHMNYQTGAGWSRWEAARKEFDDSTAFSNCFGPPAEYNVNVIRDTSTCLGRRVT